MIPSTNVLEGLVDHGVTLVSGVPCSYLTPVINQAISDPRVCYLAATQEGEAVAVAAGAWLGGGLGCAIGQNSGLGNMVNPLTSLLHPASIPALLLVTWRGEPGYRDEPQHALMGRTTTDLLDLMEVPWDLLPTEPVRLSRVLSSASRHMSTGRRPYAIVMQKDTVAPATLYEDPVPRSACTVRRSPDPPQLPARAEVLSALLATAPVDAALISATGYTSRELYTLDDRPANFYLVGAMGSAASVGLGVATQTTRPVIVIDGDGGVLMRLGALATVGRYGRAGLVHLVLDNGQHESTGGQSTGSVGIDLAGVAAACGYRDVYTCSSIPELADILPAALAGAGPALIHLPIRAGALGGLGRPTVTPAEVARRFRSFVTAPTETTPVAAAPLTAGEKR
ncbi:phosphonopyruvate decarboxylase [Solwaraspora sp. WMMD1047]|uniref:phosphonopyruvate decarboxylase n=1 Tax=Solwaraspora sp. WMMD1047 TaxID=3016102 RepID=UPI0024170CF0|nr:phosphonopyruvate decarboxylase [Solwaraspora sp. WMMD1047]MDG4834263.1 phosphonopyruvate decarboxylase [Solwaraspora sp. WMMD1047]